MAIIAICQRCGQQITWNYAGSPRKYCHNCRLIVDREQGLKWRSEHLIPKEHRILPPRTCAMCGSEYIPVQDYQRYCSAECRNNANKAKLAEKAKLTGKSSCKKRDSRKVTTSKLQKYAKRVCPKCGREYQPGAHNQAYCSSCIRKAQMFAIGADTVSRREYLTECGFIALNSPFDGCDGHHIDPDHVIYIPKSLHRRIPHNLKTGKNMVEINTLAIEFLRQTTA